MHKLIEEILKKGFSLEASYNHENDRFEYELDGFYKSGSIVLYENEYGSLTGISRYNEIDIIDCFYDLIAINYRWWRSSKDRYDGWATPNGNWLPFLIAEGFVKEEIKEEINVVKTYK